MSTPASQPPAPLEAVLREALVLAESSLSRGEDQAIAEVARRLGPATPFSLDPVCTELVHAALTVILQLNPAARATFHPIAHSVAESLYEHPATRQRLESLWLRLTQEQPA